MLGFARIKGKNFFNYSWESEKKIFLVSGKIQSVPMVMTYVLDADIRRSARLLDKGRVWKQVMEAKQILSLLCDLRVLGMLFESFLGPMPINGTVEQRTWWIRAVFDAYKAWNYRVVRDTTPNPNNFYNYFTYHISQEVVVPVEYKKLDKLAWMNHTTVRMWLGYELVLAEYINIHLDEHLSRGGNTQYVKFPLTYTVEKHHWPVWTQDPDCHRRHRSKIYDQEYRKYCIDLEIKQGIVHKSDKGKILTSKRNSFEHYYNIEEFHTAGPHDGYVWY